MIQIPISCSFYSTTIFFFIYSVKAYIHVRTSQLSFKWIQYVFLLKQLFYKFFKRSSSLPMTKSWPEYCQLNCASTTPILILHSASCASIFSRVSCNFSSSLSILLTSESCQVYAWNNLAFFSADKFYSLIFNFNVPLIFSYSVVKSCSRERICIIQPI